MIKDGIEFRQGNKYGIPVDLWASQCGKVYNIKTKRYRKPYLKNREKKSLGLPPKCSEVKVTMPGKPFWDAGHQYAVKKGTTDKVEIKFSTHQLIMSAWRPVNEYPPDRLKNCWKDLPEEAKKYIAECVIVDHKNNKPLDNRLENLHYFTPLENSNHRKKWRL